MKTSIARLWLTGQDTLLFGQPLAQMSGILTALRIVGPFRITAFVLAVAALFGRGALRSFISALEELLSLPDLLDPPDVAGALGLRQGEPADDAEPPPRGIRGVIGWIRRIRPTSATRSASSRRRNRSLTARAVWSA